MQTLACNPENHIPRWLGTGLNAESCKDLISICRVEADRLKAKGEDSGSMPASLEALIGFLTERALPDGTQFSAVEKALAVDHTSPYVTLVGRPAPVSAVAQALAKPPSNVCTEERNAGFLRSIDILTVREIVASHYVEIAALQLGEEQRYLAHARRYKGCPMKPCPQNAWFYAGGVVRARYEQRQLSLLAPGSALLRHKERLGVELFDCLSDCLASRCNGSSAQIGRLLRQELRESAKFLGYPLC